MSITNQVREFVHAKVQEANAGDRVVQSIAEITQALKEAGHIVSLQYPPDMVAAHPENRDGQGVCAKEVFDLLDQIVDVGWVSGRCHAWAVEMTPQDERIKQFNSDLFESMQGALGGTSRAWMLGQSSRTTRQRHRRRWWVTWSQTPPP